MRTVVVGASSGIGRAIGIGLAARGGEVALLARRRDRIVDAAKEAGPGTLAITCDVTDPGSCQAAIAEAAAGLGGIDSVVYASAVGPLRPLTQMDPDTWRSVFDTNVIGASTVTAAALPHLIESGGAMAYLSSHSASLTAPWPGLGGYIVSKAALEKLLEAWRSEHPEVGFTRVVIGECLGGDGDSRSQFTNGWDPNVAAELGAIWLERQCISGHFVDVEEIVHVVDSVLRAGATANVPSVIITARPSRGTGEAAAALADSAAFAE